LEDSKYVDKTTLLIAQTFRLMFVSHDTLAIDPENIEKLIPKGVFLRSLSGSIFPITSKLESSGANFVGGNGHTGQTWEKFGFWARPFIKPKPFYFYSFLNFI
jgi:hypothetical protein